MVIVYIDVTCNIIVWKGYTNFILSYFNRIWYQYIDSVNLQHRISATGWLLFMRCVSFTLSRLLPTWTPAEIFDALLAKNFADYDSIICPKKKQIKVYESL